MLSLPLEFLDSKVCTKCQVLKQEVVIRAEADVIGGPARLSVSHKGIAHPNGVIVMAHAAIGWALQQIAQAEEAAIASKMDGLKIVGADGKAIVSQ